MTCLACGDEMVLGARLMDTEAICQACIDAAVRHFREAKPTARRVDLLDWARKKRAEREARDGLVEELQCKESSPDLGSI